MERDASAKATLGRIDKWQEENPEAAVHPVWEGILYHSMTDEGYAAMYGGEPDDAEEIYLAQIDRREAEYTAQFPNWRDEE